MSDHATTSSEAKPAIRKYLYVFLAQLVATALIVTSAYLPLGGTGAHIAVALGIAAGQAFLVLGFTMHLIGEKPMIFGFLAFTVLFVAMLFYLILFANNPANMLHYEHVP
jgi:heme/copper-type cytochrome/quinol oxidase subunit 4